MVENKGRELSHEVVEPYTQQRNMPCVESHILLFYSTSSGTKLDALQLEVIRMNRSRILNEVLNVPNFHSLGNLSGVLFV